MISIIIPAYNRGYIIDKCLTSILNQTYQNFEIIIVDDGSTDNIFDIIKKFKEKCDLKYIKQNKQGAQVARNRGIKEAKYDWIAFQDSDDFWLENKLELQMRILNKNNFDKNIVIYGNCYIYQEKDNKQSEWNLPSFNGTECYNDLLIKPGPVFPSLLVSKYLLKKIGYLDENVVSWQEWDTSIHLSKYGNFFHINEPLFIYNQHDNETISKNMTNYIKGYVYILNKYKEDIIRIHGLKIFNEQVIKMKNAAIQNNLYNELSNIF